MAVQWVGLVLRLYIVNSRVPVLEARAVDAQLAVLKVRALATSALFKDAPARARVLISLRLAWAKKAQASGGGARLTSRQPSSTQAPHMACEAQLSPSCLRRRCRAR